MQKDVEALVVCQDYNGSSIESLQLTNWVRFLQNESVEMMNLTFSLLCDLLSVISLNFKWHEVMFCFIVNFPAITDMRRKASCGKQQTLDVTRETMEWMEKEIPGHNYGEK